MQFSARSARFLAKLDAAYIAYSDLAARYRDYAVNGIPYLADHQQADALRDLDTLVSERYATFQSRQRAYYRLTGSTYTGAYR